MAGRRKLESLSDFQRALKQNYGLGEREAYKPWLRVQDVSSHGHSAKIEGIKVARAHHMLSEHESSFFYLAEFSDSIIDIREQFPLLPLDLSTKIAQLLDVEHPIMAYSKKKEWNVITTDFLLTRTDGAKQWYEVVSVKPAASLANKRTAEKLDIERVWWQLAGVPFHIYVMTENNQIQSKNIQWFTAPHRQGYQYPSSLMNSAKSLVRTGTCLVEDVCYGFVRELGIEPDEALMLLKCLLATKQVSVNLNTPIEETGVMDVTHVDMESAEKHYAG
ncbi:TnsA endonuclease N-terminal domain-containing protein [Enterovibrio norvegicus]|uniref:Transposase n=1 Tax=Enterovibrio norvegicus TaxID=188144 RepID=A0A2N7L8U9_9GAMM|nr:TnsA endonuclease N-terminal domain-containing protein [Enterovibrio norvegicus]PMN90690.1 transposase [Enterovibrio norvegicus]